MQKLKLFGALGAVVAGVLIVSAVSASGASGKSHSKIRNARSAAPSSVAKDATIYDYPATDGGELVELKKGTNGWSCLPDDKHSPGNDPFCFDKQSGAFFDAWMNHKEPDRSSPGLSYMLQGGSDPSNTDPYATKPDGGHFMAAPPHIMVTPTGKLDPATYSTDPENGGPWVMWAGTPYEHYMIPVK